MTTKELIDDLQERVKRRGRRALERARKTEKALKEAGVELQEQPEKEILLPTIDDLRVALRVAMAIELSTIPLYSYAMYSIPAADRSDARSAIRSVLIEEMLHVSLAANLLMSTGALPTFYDRATMPSYPLTMWLHAGQPTFDLTPATYDQVKNCFMAIEQPAPPGAPPQFLGFQTLGQLYEAIIESFLYLSSCQPAELFTDPRPYQQLTKGYLPVPRNLWDSGHPIPVSDLPSALLAINYIVQQGEGISPDTETDDPARYELSHYRKFQRIVQRFTPLPENVRPLPVNPRTADYAADVQSLSDLFNAGYGYTLLTLDQLYRVSAADERNTLVFNALMPAMNKVMAKAAGELVRKVANPARDAATPAGPTYEYFRFEPGVSVLTQLEAVAQRAAAAYPQDPELQLLVAEIPTMQDLFVS